MSSMIKREIPIAITAVTGFILLLEYYFKIPLASSTSKLFLDMGVLITALVIGLGIIKIFRIHGTHILKKTPEQWYFSVWLIALFVVYVTAGLVGTIGTNSLYTWLFKNVQMKIDETLYAVMAFVMLSATHRAFRAKNRESIFMILASAIVILKNSPLVIKYFPFFSDLGMWIFNVPSVAAYRGIRIGFGIGIVALGIRVLIGKEVGYLGHED